MKNLVHIFIATLILSATALAESPQIERVTVDQALVRAGQTAQATVVLAEPAPSGGFQVELWTDDGATVPNTVVVPAGATQVRFQVNTQNVDADHQINVAALSPQSSAHTGLTILPNRQAGSHP
jgi:hypothetical protein